MMKYLIILLGAAAFVGGYQAVANDQKSEPAKEAAKPAPFTLVTADELQKLKAEHKDIVIIDSRGGKYFDGTVVEGAVNIPADQTTAESLAKVAPSKETPLAFYCTDTSCHASELGAYKAAEAGYTKLYKMPGGIKEWQDKGFATAKIEVPAAVEPAAGEAKPEEKKAM